MGLGTAFARGRSVAVIIRQHGELDMAEENPKNEGEGSRTAAAAYNERTRRFVENEDVEAKAQEAADALGSPEGDELRKAEEKGRSRAKEEDPQVHRDT
jgi:hypothetical protein